MSSDHGHHDPGGHELEAINTGMLFKLLLSLGGLALLLSIGVVQWFYSQRAELQEKHAADGSYRLREYQAHMSEELAELPKTVAAVKADLSMLKAAPVYPGWVNPDMAATPAAVAAPATHEEPVGEIEKAPEPEAEEADDAKAETPDDAKAEKADDAKAEKPE